jgi:hypothetical protein
MEGLENLNNVTTFLYSLPFTVLTFSLPLDGHFTVIAAHSHVENN